MGRIPCPQDMRRQRLANTSQHGFQSPTPDLITMASHSHEPEFVEIVYHVT